VIKRLILEFFHSLFIFILFKCLASRANIRTSDQQLDHVSQPNTFQWRQLGPHVILYQSSNTSTWRRNNQKPNIRSWPRKRKEVDSEQDRSNSSRRFYVSRCLPGSDYPMEATPLLLHDLSW